MGPLQGDPVWSRDTKIAQFEILQNRVPYANFQKTKNKIQGKFSTFYMLFILEDITQHCFITRVQIGYIFWPKFP